VGSEWVELELERAWIKLLKKTTPASECSGAGAGSRYSLCLIVALG
jgi:hypothetical protein